MEGKKSFILYTDLIHTVGKLPDEIAGKLFKHLLEYVNDNEPETDDILVEIAFEPIKQQLKRDLLKWGDIREKRSIAGQKSAQKRKEQKQQMSTSVESVEQTSTKSTVNDNVNVNVIVNDNVNVNNIDNRLNSFRESLKPHLKKYGGEMLKDFFDYWTEKNEGGRKMRFEMSKNQPFNVSRRLGTWSKKQNQFGKSNNKSKIEQQFETHQTGIAKIRERYK